MRSGSGIAAFVGLRRCASALATVPPGNEKSKDDVEPAKTGGEEPGGPGGGGDDGERARGHETESHDGDGGNVERATGDNAGAVEKKPGGREGGVEAGALEQVSKECSGDEWGEEAESDFASGARKQWEAAAVGFRTDGNDGDEDGEDGFCEPDFQPLRGVRRARGQRGGGERGEAEDDLSPTGDGGEGRGALHGIANEAEVGGGGGSWIPRGARGHGAREAAGTAGAVLARVGHVREHRIIDAGFSVKYFVLQSLFLSLAKPHWQASREPVSSLAGLNNVLFHFPSTYMCWANERRHFAPRERDASRQRCIVVCRLELNPNMGILERVRSAKILRTFVGDFICYGIFFCDGVERPGSGGFWRADFVSWQGVHGRSAESLCGGGGDSRR